MRTGEASCGFGNPCSVGGSAGPDRLVRIRVATIVDTVQPRGLSLDHQSEQSRDRAENRGEDP